MKRTFRIGPFLPAAAVAAALSVCLIFVSLPATAVVSPQAQTAPPQTVRSASEPVLIEQPVRQLNVRYTAPAAEEPEAAPAELPPEGEAMTAGQETSSEQETSVQEDADAVPDDLVLLDTFIATAYCVTGTTSTGTYTTVGRTLAVNPNIIPYGTHVWLYLDDGTLVGDYYAEDTGSNMMANPYVIDIYMGEGSYNDCILWGAQHVSVYVEADAS